MIYWFLVLAVGLSIYNIRELAKHHLKKDIYVFACLMVAACAVGLIYLSNYFRPSISRYFLDLFKIKG